MKGEAWLIATPAAEPAAAALAAVVAERQTAAAAWSVPYLAHPASSMMAAAMSNAPPRPREGCLAMPITQSIAERVWLSHTWRRSMHGMN